jgi:diguanylate cyclase (GGDEF)-like protein
MKNKISNVRKKKKALNQRHKVLIQQAWDNETILRRFQSMELHLIRSESLSELIQVLLSESKENFDLDLVTLNLLDPDSEIQQLLHPSDIDPVQSFPNLSFSLTEERIRSLFDDSLSPKLGEYNPALHAELFLHSPQPIKSIALLLLKRDNHIIGCLNLADNRSGRFRKNTATDFLQHLSEVISVCIDMTILRDKLRNIGLKDVLTGINNRRFFDQRLPEEISRSQRYQKPLSCLFIDVDHFKQINDTYGHANGDLVLKQVASMIRQTLRVTDVVGRYGGEEFTALLTETEESKALEVAERIRQRIEEHPIELSEQTAPITVSIGVAGLQFPLDHTKSIAEVGASLVATADNALYQAKQAGRNCIIHAKQAINTKK